MRLKQAIMFKLLNESVLQRGMNAFYSPMGIIGMTDLPVTRIQAGAAELHMTTPIRTTLKESEN